MSHLGLGFKYKIRTGINVGIEFSMRKLFADNLDVTEQKQNFDLDAPYKIESSIMKNQELVFSYTCFPYMGIRVEKRSLSRNVN